MSSFPPPLPDNPSIDNPPLIPVPKRDDPEPEIPNDTPTDPPSDPLQEPDTD
jgi:hypothetical protein